MKNFIKAKVTNTGFQYADIVGESIRLISAEQFDAVYIFYYDIFEEKLYIQRLDHVNKCIGTPLNSKVVLKDGWDAIAERDGDLYANTTIDNRISLRNVLSNALLIGRGLFETNDFIYQTSQKVSGIRLGWKILFRSSNYYSSVLRHYLWKKVENYVIAEDAADDTIPEDIDSYYEWHTDQGDMRIVHQYTICNHRDHNRSAIIYNDGKYICTKCNSDITKAVNNILYDTKDTNILNKKNKLYQLGFDNFNMPDLFGYKHMVPISKLPSYYDGTTEDILDLLKSDYTVDDKKYKIIQSGDYTPDEIRRAVLQYLSDKDA